eukprot:1066251_1
MHWYVDPYRQDQAEFAALRDSEAHRMYQWRLKFRPHPKFYHLFDSNNHWIGILSLHYSFMFSTAVQLVQKNKHTSLQYIEDCIQAQQPSFRLAFGSGDPKW